MGIFDKAKDLGGEHSDKLGEGVEQGGDLVDERTGGQHAEHVDKGQDLLHDQLGTGGADGAAADSAGGPGEGAVGGQGENAGEGVGRGQGEDEQDRPNP